MMDEPATPAIAEVLRQNQGANGIICAGLSVLALLISVPFALKPALFLAFAFTSWFLAWCAIAIGTSGIRTEGRAVFVVSKIAGAAALILGLLAVACYALLYR